jgi:hypothetical protein
LFPAATNLNKNCFSGCTSLKTVMINSALNLGESCFKNCSKLTTVSFPAATTLNNDCFKDCTVLTTVSFPVATTLGQYCFYYCTALTTVTFPKVKTLGENCFQGCFTLTLLSLPSVLTTDLNINKFNNYFNNCSPNLTVLITGNYLTSSKITLIGYNNNAGSKITYSNGMLTFPAFFTTPSLNASPPTTKVLFKFNKIIYQFNSISTGGNINIDDNCESFDIYFQDNNTKILYMNNIKIPDSIIEVKP